MKVRLGIARYAELQANLIYSCGLGATEIGPGPSTFAIIALIEVAWGETNRRHELRVVLVDADEQPFQVPTLTGDQPFEIRADFDVGRPAGATVGRSFLVPVALNVGPLQPRPGVTYIVRALVDGQLLDETALITRIAPPQPATA